MVLLDKKINGVDFEKIENHDMDRSAGIETVKLSGKWYALLSDIFSVNSQAALMPLFVVYL